MKSITKILIVGLICVLCLSVLSGCALVDSLFGAKYDIEWTTLFEKEECNNSVITVEGYETLPTKIPAGDEIVVTIEGINGYKVHRVKVNNRKLAADENGKYVFTVNEKTEVKITLREKVAAVNLPDMTFYAGEQLDRKAVQAEIVYATGRTEMTNKYSVIYQSEGADSFSLGDTYYTVKVSADRDNLYKVAMKQPVCCKGVINPYGGVIAESYVEALKTNTDIENVTIQDDGSITFTFTKPLTADIALPTVDQISKGEGDDFVFQKWSASITAGSDKSVTATAVYTPKLATLTGVKLEMREADGEQVPYLVVTGTFNAANSVYLYLNEGNKKLELNGTSVGDENTQRGDSFELLFDMRETNDKSLLDYWLDVKLRAEIDGNIETQEINVADYSEDFVDLESHILHNGYRYEFQTYQDFLKVETSEYFYHGYTMSYSLNDKGEVILTISGNIVAKYAGNFAKLDIEYDADTGNKTVETQYCVIDKDGNYTVSMNLFSIPLNHNAYVHFWVVDTIEDDNIIYVGKENNLQNEWCQNTDLDSKYNNVGLITGGGIRCANDDSTKTYFVGKGKWGGVVIYGKNDLPPVPCNRESAEIYLEDNRVKIAITGTFTGTKAQMEAELDMWVCDLQENPYYAGRTDWSGNWYVYVHEMETTVYDDNTFKVVIDVTDIAWSETDYPKPGYTTHLGRPAEGSNGQNPDLKLSGELGNSSVVFNGKTYSLLSVKGSGSGAEFWGCLALVIN